MVIGVGGHYEGNPDDPVTIVPGALLDQPVLQGPVSQEYREDLQISKFVAWLETNGARRDIAVSVGEDPPDRYVSSDGTSWATELTEFTIEDVRRDYAPVRELGRSVQDALVNSADHTHLKGRVVALAVLPDPHEQLPRETDDLKGALTDALREDRGTFGEGADLSRGLPDQIPVDRGNYGEVGPFWVQVNSGDPDQSVLVSVSLQATLVESEVLEALYRRIGKKDREVNEIVVASCGLPDSAGYICPIEHFLFDIVVDAKKAGRLAGREPKALNGVVLQAADGRLAEIYHRAGSTVPWHN